MTYFGLTAGQVLIAFVVGLAIAGAGVYATAPHPVIVPVQVITPVPTPPPVIITEHPTPAPVQPVVTRSALGQAQQDINETVIGAMNMAAILMVLIGIAVMAMFMMPMLDGRRR